MVRYSDEARGAELVDCNYSFKGIKSQGMARHNDKAFTKKTAKALMSLIRYWKPRRQGREGRALMFAEGLINANRWVIPFSGNESIKAFLTRGNAKFRVPVKFVSICIDRSSGNLHFGFTSEQIGFGLFNWEKPFIAKVYWGERPLLVEKSLGHGRQSPGQVWTITIGGKLSCIQPIVRRGDRQILAPSQYCYPAVSKEEAPILYDLPGA